MLQGCVEGISSGKMMCKLLNREQEDLNICTGSNRWRKYGEKERFRLCATPKIHILGTTGSNTTNTPPRPIIPK